jgi:GNAT superfamily N-acetyltransferase
LETANLGGWTLRYSKGITRRANSVFASAPGTADAGDDLDLSVDLSVRAVAAWYATRGLPARYQLCVATRPSGLDALLGAAGYAAVAHTGVHLAKLEELVHLIERAVGAGRGVARDALAVELTDAPTPVWWACYATGDEVDADGIAGRAEIVAQIRQPTAYALARVNGVPAGVGSVVVDGEFAGFYNVATCHAFRRQGVAQAVMAALAAWGQGMGARRAYLQVMDQNLAARTLYQRLGFAPLYTYHYREQV